MSHRPITEDDLHGFIDGALDANSHAAVVAHLKARPDAAKRVEEMGEHRSMLRIALGPIAQEPIPPKLDLARLVAAHRKPAMFPGWRAAAAAVALVLLGGAGGWAIRGIGQLPPEGLRALESEAAASYAVYTSDHSRPVEIRAGERAELVAWIAQRFGRPLAIPNLAASGYRFMGGRIVATGHGPAVMLMYDDDKGNRIVMLARPMAVDANAPMTRYAKDGVNGLSWSDAGLGYSIVGTTLPQMLHPLATEARRQIQADL